ncbi:MAG: hypothetical protein HC801_06445 [Nitrospira sp.]|nr:hypothetical protein [Nitrospira sp.]
MADKTQERTNGCCNGSGAGGYRWLCWRSPKPVSTMTQDQVREHADKAFEKLKQEEKNRTTGSEVAPY